MLENSLLWRFYHPLTECGGYIFGTMHVKDLRAFGRIDELQNILLEGHHLYIETNLDLANSPMAQRAFTLPENLQLSNYLSPKALAKCRSMLLRSFDLDIMQYNKLHPMAVSGAITTSILSKDESVSLDHYLWNLAKSMNIHHDGIETIEEQLAIFKSMNIERQLNAIVQISKNPSKFRKKLLSLIRDYQSENIRALISKSKKGMGRDKVRLLKERNFIMAHRISALSVKHSAIFAVGAGHLAGKNGILNLMKQKGYVVKAQKKT